MRFLCTVCSEASGAGGWFFLSGRLRRDCQFSYAFYLENTRWHLCPGLHLSLIYCRSYTRDLFSHKWAAQVLCPPPLVRLNTDDWICPVASYAEQADVQTGSTMSPPEKWSSFSCRVNLFKESFYCDLKANIKLPAGKRDTCMRYALFHRGQMSVLSHVPSLIVSKIKWTRSFFVRRVSEPTEMVKRRCAVCFPAGENVIYWIMHSFDFILGHFANVKSKCKSLMHKKNPSQFMCK